MIGLLIVIAGLLALAATSMLFGADSRDRIPDDHARSAGGARGWGG